MQNWRETFYIAFSPDSKMVAVERGAELGKRKLVVIDLATGRQQVVAQGFFSGFSFSPDGSELAYSKSGQEFSVDRRCLQGRHGRKGTTAVTDDHRSIDPLWGPDGRIVFDKVRNLKSEFGPKAQLYLTTGAAARPSSSPGSACRACSSGSARSSGRPTAAACWPSSADRTRATR